MFPLGCSPYSAALKLSFHSSRTTLLMLLLICLFGCAPVGPDYTPPDTSTPSGWHNELGSGLTNGSAGPSHSDDWWTVFNDPILTELMKRSVNNNLNLQQAMAKLREARARSGISRAGGSPTLDFGAATTRSKGSGNSGGGTTRNFFSVGFDAGWEVDIFGGVRRAVEASEAELAAEQETLRDVLVTLCAEVGRNYLEVRILQTRLWVTEENFTLQQETYDLNLARYQAGLSSELPVQQARSNLENTGARIPGLRNSLEEAKNRIAVLTGEIPGSLHALLARRGSIPMVSTTMSVGIPAETLRQRPDIRRAERNLAAQSARVGVATADLYPKFRLAGSIGLESGNSADLFASGSDTWSIRPSLSWKVFDGKAIRRNIEVRSAIEEQYLLAYKATVLSALEEVENTLNAHIEELRRRERLQAAVEAARSAEKLAENQYEAGLSDFITVLDTQRSLLSLEEQLIESQGKVSINMIRLYKALGGGWSTVSPPTPGRHLINKQPTQ